MSTPQALIFGEVLFDCFPDGRHVLGGAPFNVAWNLKGLGHDPCFVSAVGNDDAGMLVRRKMVSWEIDTDELQKVEGRPTGTVEVSGEQEEPRYHIHEDQAYDYIADPIDRTRTSACDLVYHGSLVYRSERSRQTLSRLISDAPMPRFVDINIRDPHFDPSWTSELLGGARWVKLNTEELARLTDFPVDGRPQIEKAVAAMKDRFGDAIYFVTCAGDGAYAFNDSKVDFCIGEKPVPFRDAVGAGDAFSAATISGILNGWPTVETLQFAVRYAERICGITGGTTNTRSVYRSAVPRDS